MAADRSGRVSQEQLVAREARLLVWLTVAVGMWFVCFVAGGAWLAYRLFHSVQSSCPYGLPGCGGSNASVTGPIVVLAVGFVGFLVTGFAASIVSVRCLGRAATSFLRARRTPQPPTGEPSASG